MPVMKIKKNYEKRITQAVFEPKNKFSKIRNTLFNRAISAKVRISQIFEPVSQTTGTRNNSKNKCMYVCRYIILIMF